MPNQYELLCARLARLALAYAREMSDGDDTNDDPINHWLEVYMDEHLPYVSPEVIKAHSAHPADPNPLQSDVWDAVNALME